MGFIFTDPFTERDQIYAIERLNTSFRAWQNIFKSPQGEAMGDNLIDLTNTHPVLPKTIATQIAMTVPNASNNKGVDTIAEEVSLGSVQEQSELWDKLTEEHYEWGGDYERNMQMSVADFWTMGFAPGGAKPGDVQYGVWATQAYDAWWQNFGLRGKWAGGIAGFVPALWGGMPVGRSQAYVRDLILYDKKIREGATPQEAQKDLAINVSFSQVEGLGEKLSIVGQLGKYIDMFKEAHEVGGETIFRAMWKEMSAGRPINFNRDRWMNMETLKPENDPRYQELITEYGWTEEEAKRLFYEKVGRPLKAYDENGEQHYTSLDSPARIYFFAGRKSHGPAAGMTSYAQYSKSGWAFKQKAIYDNEPEQQMLYSPGRYQASLFAKPGTEAYNWISGAIDFSSMVVEELAGAKGIGAVGKAFKDLRRINPNLDELTKTIDITNNKIFKDDEFLDDVGKAIDGTKPGDTAEGVNDYLGVWKGWRAKRTASLASRTNRKKYLTSNWMPKIFRETKDEMLNRPFMYQNVYQPLVEAIKKDAEVAAVLMDTNPFYRQLQKSTRQKLIRVANNKGVEGVKDVFGKLLDEGLYVGGKRERDKLPGDMLPKGASFLTNKILIETYKKGARWADAPDAGALQRIAGKSMKILGKEDAAFRSFGTFLGSALRKPKNVTAKLVGVSLAGIKALPGVPLKALGAMAMPLRRNANFDKKKIRLYRPKSTEDLVIGPRATTVESKLVRERLSEALEKIGIIDKNQGPRFEKYLGFSSAFHSNSDPYMRSLASSVPDFGIKGLNKNAAYDQLVAHLQTVGYSVEEMAPILRDFWKIDFRKKKQVSKFMFDQNVRDVNRVAILGGQWKPVMRAFAKMYETTLEQMTAYFVSGYADEAITMPHVGNKYTKTERIIYQDWKNETYGMDIGTGHLFSEFADNIQPFIDYRLIRRAYGNTWNELENALTGMDAFVQNIKDVGKWTKYNLTFWDDSQNINPYRNGFVGTSKLNEDAFTLMADYYTRKLFKPFVLLRGAFFTRVFMEEQMRVVAAGLDGFFNHPIHYIMWVTSGSGAKRAVKMADNMEELYKAGKLDVFLKKGMSKEEAFLQWQSENVDAMRLMDSYEYLEATQKTFNLSGMQGREQRRIKGMDYILRKKDNSDIKTYVNGLRGELLQLRADTISRKVAEYGYGSDELAKWLVSKEGKAARRDLRDWGGSKWNGILNDKDFIDQYLQSVEARIRIKTGGMKNPMDEVYKVPEMVEASGTGVRVLPGSKYRYNLDANTEDIGSKELRDFIATGKLSDGNKLIDFNVGYVLKGDFGTKKIGKLDDILTERFVTKGKNGDGLDMDMGWIKTVDTNADNQTKVGQIWDNFVDVGFEWLMTKPIGYLNRSTVFKQYRYMYLIDNWKDINKEARLRIIKEARAMKIPKIVIDEMEALSKTVAPTKTAMNYEIANITSKAMGLSGTKNLLYDASKRHLISDITRNIFPFPEIWFEVANTWGKLLANKPYMLRQAQVAVQGGETFKVGGYGTEGWITNNPQPGRQDEKMFVYPFAPFLSKLIYGKETFTDEDGKTRKVDVAAKAYLSGINLLGQGFVPGPNPGVGFALDKVVNATVGWNYELKEFLFGGFMPPETIREIVPLSPWLKKTWAYIGPDANDDINIEKSEFAQMRASATISIFRYGSSVGEPRRMFDAGKLDKYLDEVDKDWELIKNAQVGSPEYYELLRTIDRAYLEYSKVKAKHLFGVQALAQFILPTGFTPTYYVEDKQGTIWNATVLADEYRRILREFDGDDASAAMEFLNMYGIEHGYLTAPASVSDEGRQNYTQKSLVWREQNKEILSEAKLSAWLLLPDNPAGERASWDLRPDKTQLTPDQFRRKVNDTLGYFIYQNFKRMVEATDLDTIQKNMITREMRNNLIMAKEGFQEDDWGLPASVSTKDIFREMRRVWPNNELIMSTEAGKGFVEMLEQWEEFEKLSIQISNSKTPTWWLESSSPEAKFMRILMNEIAQGIIKDYPDFWHVWTGVMLKFYRDDKELLEEMFDED